MFFRITGVTIGKRKVNTLPHSNKESSNKSIIREELHQIYSEKGKPSTLISY